MRLVLDTNVLIAALVADGLCRDLVRRRTETHILVSSQSLLDELRDKLEVKFQVRAKAIPFIRAYTERVELVVPASLPKDACRDPDDVTVLARQSQTRQTASLQATRTCSSSKNTTASASSVPASGSRPETARFKTKECAHRAPLCPFLTWQPPRAEVIQLEAISSSPSDCKPLGFHPCLSVSIGGLSHSTPASAFVLGFAARCLPWSHLRFADSALSLFVF